MRLGIVVVVLVLASGCLVDHTVVCGDRRCPAGDTCTPGGCAAIADAEACVGKVEGEQCTSTLGPGACVGGACHAVICGDGTIEPGEVCDDSNTVPGDGCSPECDSDERCGNEVIDQVLGEECDGGALLSNDGCASQCKLERPVWRDVTPTGITPRAGIAMAYDANLQRIVAFGGFTLDGVLAETWEYGGGQWQPVIPIVSPPERQDSALVYDRVRRRVMMFGGISTGVLGDMWEFDGTTWIELHPAHLPPARGGPRMAYDSARARTVLYGGYNALSVTFADTWEWDGTDWVEIHPAMSPGQRYWHDMAFDEGRGQVVLFGGLPNGGNDTWLYDGTNWTKVSSSTKPATSYLGAMAYDADIDRVVLERYDDPSLWAWDGTNWALLPGTAPAARFQTAMAYSESDQALVMFGGAIDSAGQTNETWSYASGAWSLKQQSAVNPNARAYPGTAYDARRGRIVMFGGISNFGDTWEWSEQGWQLRATSGPPPRAFMSMTYDGPRGRVVMFGGSASALVNDTWEWDGAVWMQRMANGAPGAPPARSDAPIAFDTVRARAVMFGGHDAASDRDDTWTWDGTAWTDVTPASGSPPKRSRGAMAFDPIRGRAVLFGGYDAVGVRGDTWEWDGTSWTERTPTSGGPLARNLHAMVYDPQRRRVLLFGGIGGIVGEIFDDVWEWDGTAWTQVTPVTSSPGRYGPMLAYDAVHRQLVRFGGRTIAITSSNDTWAMLYESAQPSERCVLSSADEDLDGLVGCADPDCWGRCAPLCPPGAPCATDAPRCGDGTCDPIEDRFICPMDCP